MSSQYHISVLLQEAIDSLHIQPGRKYIDATLGGGGHTIEILHQGGHVLGIDTDKEAIEYVKEKVKSEEELILVKGNFRDIDTIAKENQFDLVSGILFDLGVSSHQFDTAERGFSFSADSKLDMRMDTDLQVTAKDLVNVLPKGELAALFFEYGEERFAQRIAGRIVESRQNKPIETTGELESIIRKSVPFTDKKIHPATRVFQALRIAVNSEMDSLKEALPKALTLLEAQGRLVIITFHSLEDRIVKHAFIDWEKQGKGVVLTKKPIEPSEDEIIRNPRSRSAKLRIFEKR